METETKKGFELRNEHMKRVPLSSIRNGLFLMTKKGILHHLFNIIPVECKRCGFLSMEIKSEDFQSRTLALSCPYCGAQRILYLTVYKISRILFAYETNIVVIPDIEE